MTPRDRTDAAPAATFTATSPGASRQSLGRVGVVVLDWEAARASAGTEALAERLATVLALGVDTCLVLRGGSPPPALAASGPGSLVVWADEAAGQPTSGPSNGMGPERAHHAAATWAHARLLDGSTVEHVLVIDRPDEALDVLDRLVTDLSGYPEATDDPAWRLEVEGFDPFREREVESWLALANGRTGTRGSLGEPHDQSSPAVYVAGIYAWNEGRLPGPELLRGPQWTHVTPRVAGEPVSLDSGTTVEHRRVLDIRQGLLFREWVQHLPGGEEWRFRSVRLASLADRAILALECEAAADGAPVQLDGGVPLPDRQDGVAVASEAVDGERAVVTLASSRGGSATFATTTKEEAGRLRRLVAVTRTTDGFGEGEAEEVLAAAESAGLGTVRARHRRAWRDRWRDADVTLGTDTELQRAMRFAVAALIGSGDPESDLASIGARGLTGSGYRGHVFWDTEVFILPFFIWTHPPTARALLSYRHRTLPAARARAAEMGYDGALYAWESADTGEETAPLFAWRPDGTRVEIQTGLMEHHISADVAWAAWQYWRVTGDDEFLVTRGAEMILETARFWASRAELGTDDRYHVDRVIGPDEYHEDVLDNAFTNVMARWNLAVAAELVYLLATLDPAAAADLTQRLKVRRAEVRRWRAIAARLVDGFDPQTKLYEQFAGFFQLEDVRAVDIAPRPFTGDTVLGVARSRRAQMVKQADVLMLPLMVPEVVPGAVAESNYRYYEPRTSHGSSLSPAAHAAVAARVGAVEDAEEYFRMAASIDLTDQMGNASQGLHFAAMGGLWQAAVFGFGGVRAEATGLRIDPVLPHGWGELRFAVRWRGVRVGVDVGPDGVTVDLDRPATIALGQGQPAARGPGRFSSPLHDRKRGET